MSCEDKKAKKAESAFTLPRSAVVRRRTRAAFTLIELLIVISIITVLIGLLLPAVQKVREAANRASCANNLHQVSLGLLNYEMNHGELPAAMVGNRSTWRHEILPYVEQVPAASAFDSSKAWYEGDNLSLVARAKVPVFLCPSASLRAEVRWVVVDGVPKTELQDPLPGNDYEAILGIEPKIYAEQMGAASDDLTRLAGRTQGAMVANIPTKMQDLTDGASNTILLAETISRPYLFDRSGDGAKNFVVKDGKIVSGMNRATCWADPTGPYVLSAESKAKEDSNAYPLCFYLNRQNYSQPYAFHSGGVNTALLDGSVRFIAESIENTQLLSMITAAGEDLVIGPY